MYRSKLLAAAAMATVLAFNLPHPGAADTQAATSNHAGGSFGLKEAKDNYVVDTGAGLIFSVSRVNGDITSMKYTGRECEAPAEKTHRNSHYASGLSKSSKFAAEQDPHGDWVKISVEDEGLGVTQYYIAKKGEANIYMATYAENLPSPGEMRYIVYLDRTVLTNVPKPSDNSLSDDGVEGKDVFKNSKDGHTTSKFYGSGNIIDRPVHGVSGDGIAVFFDMGNREHSSGGPFFRDIENQSGSDATEFYNYMFSGHTQTEPYRPGLKGPYALQFTNGQQPTPPDYAFIGKLNLKGYVPASGRGAVTGTVSGMREGGKATVALSSPTAQYWARPDANGRYTIKGVLPGTYSETLYDVELAAARKKVTVSAGQTSNSDIKPTLFIPPAIFRIGTWDGTPNEFLNADKIHDHHPSDSVMTPFTDGNFVVGESKDGQWPLGQWKDVNNNQRITFNLTPEQAKTPLTLRVGITIAYKDGRPQIDVNDGAWKSPLPEASDQPKDSRCITRGTFRGNNDIFAFEIPQGVLHPGTNTIDIHVDGKKSFPGFLMADIVYDAVDLVTTADAKKAAESVAK